MQSQVYFVSSSRQVNISGVSFVRQKARITSLMLSVVMSLLPVVASGAQAVVCVWVAARWTKGCSVSGKPLVRFYRKAMRV